MFYISTVTEKEFHEEFDKLLDVLGVKSPFFLIVQVWKILQRKIHRNGIYDELQTLYYLCYRTYKSILNFQRNMLLGKT